MVYQTLYSFRTFADEVLLLDCLPTNQCLRQKPHKRESPEYQESITSQILVVHEDENVRLAVKVEGFCEKTFIILQIFYASMNPMSCIDGIRMI